MFSKLIKFNKDKKWFKIICCFVIVITTVNNPLPLILAMFSEEVPSEVIQTTIANNVKPVSKPIKEQKPKSSFKFKLKVDVEFEKVNAVHASMPVPVNIQEPNISYERISSLWDLYCLNTNDDLKCGEN